MAPAVTIDNTPDFGTSDFEMPTAPAPKSGAQRTLLLAPPSVASHPDALTKVAEAYDRSATDIQMLDRLAMGLVALPSATYDVVLLLTDVDCSRTESGRILDRQVMEKLVQAMKVGGSLRSQDGNLGSAQSKEQTEAILAGLVAGEGEGLVKPDTTSGVQTVTLSFGKKKKANAAAVPANEVEAANSAAPAGVGFDDGTTNDDDDDMEIPDDEELQQAGQIDPNTMLTEDDRQKPIIIPEACKPTTKRRRACKDCTCGLAERLNAEDKAKRANADENLAKLSANDLTEVDFTVQGKVGSCGNCALGDAFRCDGCPYIGLPAFKPGEEVRLVNNDVQL
ncbi:hypothetical protein BTJ68_13135 [Hortaea werneckii EXF-2000]|uniref:Uncharacterized protein n=1 Tax=Hortaea werneckii EXF-2000 TaxID=1157616 RepID=A0A1Z5SR55_HORWE|nr:hypothetical protein BTJ68_13135 [Hortaea werneckii EXF-2000]